MHKKSMASIRPHAINYLSKHGAEKESHVQHCALAAFPENGLQVHGWNFFWTQHLGLTQNRAPQKRQESNGSEHHFLHGFDCHKHIADAISWWLALKTHHQRGIHHFLPHWLLVPIFIEVQNRKCDRKFLHPAIFSFSQCSASPCLSTHQLLQHGAENSAPCSAAGCRSTERKKKVMSSTMLWLHFRRMDCRSMAETFSEPNIWVWLRIGHQEKRQESNGSEHHFLHGFDCHKHIADAISWWLALKTHHQRGIHHFLPHWLLVPIFIEVQNRKCDQKFLHPAIFSFSQCSASPCLSTHQLLQHGAENSAPCSAAGCRSTERKKKVMSSTMLWLHFRRMDCRSMAETFSEPNIWVWLRIGHQEKRQESNGSEHHFLHGFDCHKHIADAISWWLALKTHHQRGIHHFLPHWLLVPIFIEVQNRKCDQKFLHPAIFSFSQCSASPCLSTHQLLQHGAENSAPCSAAGCRSTERKNKVMSSTVLWLHFRRMDCRSMAETFSEPNIWVWLRIGHQEKRQESNGSEHHFLHGFDCHKHIADAISWWLALKTHHQRGIHHFLPHWLLVPIFIEVQNRKCDRKFLHPAIFSFSQCSASPCLSTHQLLQHGAENSAPCSAAGCQSTEQKKKVSLSSTMLFHSWFRTLPSGNLVWFTKWKILEAMALFSDDMWWFTCWKWQFPWQTHRGYISFWLEPGLRADSPWLNHKNCEPKIWGWTWTLDHYLGKHLRVKIDGEK